MIGGAGAGTWGNSFCYTEPVGTANRQWGALCGAEFCEDHETERLMKLAMNLQSELNQQKEAVKMMFDNLYPVNTTMTTTTTTPEPPAVATQAQLDTLTQTVADLTDTMATTDGFHQESYDTAWLLYSTSLVMLMQLGFALVEAGSVRKKSYRHVFLKNLLDFTVGVTMWWMIGFWVAFPDITYDFMILDWQKNELFWLAPDARFFVFQTVFSSTAITIVSGAMAERTRMEAYLCFCLLMGGMIYSVVVRWTWGGGWLAELDVPYHDFAGSGVVHMTGGVAAFIGAYLVGPRAGRWEEESSLRDDDKYKPHSLDNIIMGCLILWFGWFGFNPGSTTSLIEDSADVASTAYLNTMITPCFSAITTMAFGVTRHARYSGPTETAPPIFDLGKICNGVLAGLVGITAGCDSIPPEWCLILGIMCGIGIEFWSWFMNVIHVDDPVDAIGVHGFCGIIGVLAIGLMHRETGAWLGYGTDLFVTQLKGIGGICGYVVGTSFVYFYCVYAFGLLRMNMVIEIVGIDYWEFHDGAEFDITELEMKALKMYKAALLDRLEGDVWGLTEDTAIRYAKMHRRTTVFWLCVGMFYNYFFYCHFEWRGWEFFSVVNLAIGGQSACASHAEFKLKPSDPKLKPYCGLVVCVGMGLAICNYCIAPQQDLIAAWLRTMSLTFAWSWWFHFRVQPVDWDGVIEGEQRVEAQRIMKAKESGVDPDSMKSSSMSVYLAAMGGTNRAKGKGPCAFFVSIFFMGRVQHILESTLSYSSVTSDMWTGLDEWRRHDESNGEDGSKVLSVVLCSFSLLQFSGTLARLIVPHKHRSLNFFRAVLAITAMSEFPIAMLVLFESDSLMKWVSVTLSLFSVAVQISNLIVATVVNAKSKRFANMRPEENKLPVTHLKMQVAGEKKAPPVIDVKFREGVTEDQEVEIIEGVYAAAPAKEEPAAPPPPTPAAPGAPPPPPPQAVV